MSGRRRAALIVALLASLATAGIAFAQSSASFDLSWNVLGGGGGESESASFAAGSTIGQPLTGNSESAGFQLDAGFWPGVAGGIVAAPTPGPGDPTATPGPGDPTDTPAPGDPTDTPAPGDPTSTPPPAGSKGDANCDGMVNAIDAAFILQFGAGLIGDLPCADLADANQDGDVTAVDAALILQFSAGLFGMLPP